MSIKQQQRVLFLDLQLYGSVVMRRGRHPTNSFEADSNGEVAVCVIQPTFSLHPINLRWLLLLRRLEKGDRGTLCLSPSSFPLSPLPALEVMKGIPSPLFLLWLILLSLRDCPSRDSDSGGGGEGTGGSSIGRSVPHSAELPY